MHLNFRSAASSTDLKRSFFENNLCAFNIASPQKRPKKLVNTNIVPQGNQITMETGASTNVTENVYDGDVFLPSGIYLYFRRVTR